MSVRSSKMTSLRGIENQSLKIILIFNIPYVFGERNL